VNILLIKYKKRISLQHHVRATKSHIQNSTNHFTETSDRTYSFQRYGPRQGSWRSDVYSVRGLAGRVAV